MEISDKRQNNETDTTMENNNNLTQEDEREKLLRELSVKAENLRIKYSEAVPCRGKGIKRYIGKNSFIGESEEQLILPM